MSKSRKIDIPGSLESIPPSAWIVMMIAAGGWHLILWATIVLVVGIVWAWQSLSEGWHIVIAAPFVAAWLWFIYK